MGVANLNEMLEVLNDLSIVSNVQHNLLAIYSSLAIARKFH